ncbi:hypothetical protein ES703_106726 [subsurface metagenome]
MGSASLESITQAPDASKGIGYLDEFYDNQDTDVIIGHTYCIVTKDGTHYAKIYVTDMGTGQPPAENQSLLVITRRLKMSIPKILSALQSLLVISISSRLSSMLPEG